MKDSNFVNTWNSALIDNYYTQWRNNPDSVDENWNAFFHGFEWANNEKASTVSSLEKRVDKEQSSQILSDASKQARFTGAIYAFRSIGHTQAHFNPLLDTVKENQRLQLDSLGFSEKDLNDIYNTGNYLRGKKCLYASSYHSSSRLTVARLGLNIFIYKKRMSVVGSNPKWNLT